MKEVKKEKVEWDKKRILLFVLGAIILLVIGFQLKTITLDQNTVVKEDEVSFKKDVKGAETLASPNQDIKKNIQNQINSLKNEAQNIDLGEVASSSPQVQKVINDLKALQNFPSNQLRQTCERICSGL